MKKTQYYKTSKFIDEYTATEDEIKLLKELNQLMVSPPSVFDDNKTLDAYYEKVINLENKLGDKIKVA